MREEGGRQQHMDECEGMPDLLCECVCVCVCACVWWGGEGSVVYIHAMG